jgi:hypothetical protein
MSELWVPDGRTISRPEHCTGLVDNHGPGERT